VNCRAGNIVIGNCELGSEANQSEWRISSRWNVDVEDAEWSSIRPERESIVISFQNNNQSSTRKKSELPVPV